MTLPTLKEEIARELSNAPFPSARSLGKAERILNIIANCAMKGAVPEETFNFGAWLKNEADR